MNTRIMSMALAGALACSPAGCGKKEPPPRAEPVRPVKVMKVSPSAEGLQRTFSGSVRSGQVAELAFQVGGKVAAILVNVGDEVAEDQLLARLDRHDYELAVKNTESNLESARAAARKSESSYQRAKSLYENNTVSKDELEQTEAQRNSDRAQVEALQAQLEQARNQLAYTELKAPFPGFISKQEIQEFETVSPGQAVLALVDPRALEVRLGIPENLIARVRRGQAVGITLESLPGKTLAGKVSEVGVALDADTGTYPLTVSLAEASPEVRPGMAAEVTFAFVFRGGKGIIVPTSALLEDIQTGERYVWVYRDGRVSKRKVEIGDLVAAGVEILSGLEGGETVVTAGVHRLEEGQKVRPLEDAAK